MSKLRFILFILMLTIAGYLALSNSSSKKIEVNNPNLIDFEDSAPVDTEGDGGGDIWQDEISDFYDISYDLSGIEDEAVISDIERFVSDRVDKFKKDGNFNNLTEEDKQVLGFNDGRKYTLDFSYEIKESSKVLSYIVRTYYYMGGAHGNSEVISFNYDKDSKKRIGLGDVLTGNSSEYLKKLEDLATENFSSEHGDQFFTEGVEAVLTNWSVWYAGDKTITFIFQPYQVLPYAAGVPEFIVNVSEISPNINYKYFIKSDA